MIKKIIVFLIIAAVLGGAWFFVINKNTKDIKYRTVSAERGDIQSSISATGSLNAVTTVLVGSQVSGMIRELYADFNSPVLGIACQVSYPISLGSNDVSENRTSSTFIK